MNLPTISQLLTTLAGLSTVGFVCYQADLSSVAGSLLSPVFFGLMLLWVCLPYILLHLWLTQEPARNQKFILALETAAILFSGYAYFDAFFVHIDAQSGLIFIFLPLWQCIAIGILRAIKGLFSPNPT